LFHTCPLTVPDVHQPLCRRSSATVASSDQKRRRYHRPGGLRSPLHHATSLVQYPLALQYISILASREIVSISVSPTPACIPAESDRICDGSSRFYFRRMMQTKKSFASHFFLMPYILLALVDLPKECRRFNRTEIDIQPCTKRSFRLARRTQLVPSFSQHRSQ
jgi:hypothetical protein